jgi:hypothetical protein
VKRQLHSLVIASLLVPYGRTAESLDLALVKEARQRMAAYLAAVPDYVCSVAIDRYRRPRRGREQLSDRLRLEVAFVGGKELYGLAGATRFDETPISRLIRAGGTLSTGSYALHIREVFGSARPVFTAAERIRRGGRGQVRLAFTIPRERSQLRATDGNASATVGYSGEAFLDGETFRPIELRVELDDIPAPLRFREAGERTLYRAVGLAGRELSLPETTELTLLVATGERMRNRIHFQNCRNYRAESTISFEPIDESGSPAAAASLAVPSGREIEVELLTPLHKEAAIGEAVTARIRGSDGRLPAGAVLIGNLTRLRSLYRRGRDYLEIGLRFHSIEAGGRHAAFQGAVASVDPPVHLRGAVQLLEGGQRGEAVLLIELRRLPLKSGLRLLVRAE